MQFTTIIRFQQQQAVPGPFDYHGGGEDTHGPGYNRIREKPPPPKSIAQLHPYSRCFNVDFYKLPKSIRNFAEKHGKAGFITAIETELNSFVDAKIFCEPRSPTTATRAMPSHLILGIKAGNRKKARLVANGKFQRAGIDLFKSELFTAVVDRTVTRVIYSIAAATKAHLHSFDDKQAFLNSKR